MQGSRPSAFRRSVCEPGRNYSRAARNGVLCWLPSRRERHCAAGLALCSEGCFAAAWALAADPGGDGAATMAACAPGSSSGGGGAARARSRRCGTWWEKRWWTTRLTTHASSLDAVVGACASCPQLRASPARYDLLRAVLRRKAVRRLGARARAPCVSALILMCFVKLSNPEPQSLEVAAPSIGARPPLGA